MDMENCSVQRTLDLVGEKWTLLILREALNGVHRFADFHEHLGASEPILADRLKKLVSAGILQVRPYQDDGQRTRHEYRLTEKGLELYPAIVSLMQWGDKYLADPEGASVSIEHKACGHAVRVVVQCTHDGDIIAARDARSFPGPGARKLISD